MAKYVTVPKGRKGVYLAGGYVQEDFLTRLQGPSGIAIYKEMRENSPIVGGILNQIELRARSVKWNVLNDETGVVTKSKAQLNWSDLIDSIMSFLQFGWALCEVTFKPTPDGLVLWNDIDLRSQDTLYKWQTNEFGEATDMIQRLPNSGLTFTIPLQNNLHFRTSTKKGNPEGHSILRTAYRPWYFSKVIEELEAIGIERDATGIPVLRFKDEGFDPDDPANAGVIEWAKNVVSGLRRDDQAGVVLFGSQYELSLLEGRRSSNMNVSDIVNRYARHIAVALSAQFVMLGSEGRGMSQAVEFYDNMFMNSIDAYLSIIADTLNGKDGVKQLLRWNGIEDANVRIEPEKLRTEDKVNFAAFLARTIKSGAIVPDRALEDWIRAKHSLPPVDEASRRLLSSEFELFEKGEHGFVEKREDGSLVHCDSESMEPVDSSTKYMIINGSNNELTSFEAKSLENALALASKASKRVNDTVLLLRKAGVRRNNEVYVKVMKFYNI